MMIHLKKLFLIIFVLFFPSIICTGDPNDIAVYQQLNQLEANKHVQIGLSAINTKNNEYIDFNANKRFPMDSTSKVMTAAAILKKSENDPDILNKKIFFTENDVKKSDYAPITIKHVKSGMTIFALCAAALEYSDNAAVNQLMKVLGGPNKVTKFARSIGDKKGYVRILL